MIAITTRTSIKVNPARERVGRLNLHGVDFIRHLLSRKVANVSSANQHQSADRLHGNRRHLLESRIDHAEASGPLTESRPPSDRGFRGPRPPLGWHARSIAARSTCGVARGP